MRQQMCRYQGVSSPWKAEQPHTSSLDTSYLRPVNADEVVEAYLCDTSENVTVVEDPHTEAFNLQYTRVAAATPVCALTASSKSSQDEAPYEFTSSPSLYSVSSDEPEVFSGSMDEDEQELMLLESIIQSEADCF
ncbi:hypothetical protein H4R24_005267 [Coemansia sp. RSA 988]|nr:hypothetical protein H4R24_005267 [Coemansia sp. RSA 988]